MKLQGKCPECEAIVTLTWSAAHAHPRPQAYPVWCPACSAAPEVNLTIPEPTTTMGAEVILRFGEEGTVFKQESDNPIALIGVIVAAARRVLTQVLGYEPEVELKFGDRPRPEAPHAGS